jgi:hypothetical protein
MTINMQATYLWGRMTGRLGPFDRAPRKLKPFLPLPLAVRGAIRHVDAVHGPAEAKGCP